MKTVLAGRSEKRSPALTTVGCSGEHLGSRVLGGPGRGQGAALNGRRCQNAEAHSDVFDGY